ncbi:MAG TPA: SRPBCC family protein, partial [Chitinolyticbacter sp.]|nr:SRPBCC family protein [Chitinolyticbacter sp.]
EPGRRVRGRVFKCGFEHVFFDVVVERIEPQQRFSFRWHPFPVDPKVDYTLEQPTCVEFTLHDAPDNATLLKVVESGFDGVPPHRRFEAFRMNNQGWQAQLQNIANYVQQQ